MKPDLKGITLSVIKTQAKKVRLLLWKLRLAGHFMHVEPLWFVLGHSTLLSTHMMGGWRLIS